MGLRRTPHRVARRGVERDQVHVGRHAEAPAQAGQLDGVGRTVVHVGDERPFETETTALGLEILAAGFHQHLDGIATIDGHEGIAQIVVGGVQADGEADGQGAGGETLDAGHDAHGGHRQLTCGDADVVVDAHQRLPHGFFVRQRLAHSHVDDVAHASTHRLGALGGANHLFDDLAGREVAGESGLSGGAEATRHGATGLGAHAHGRAVGVEHEHGFDATAAVEFPEELDGASLVGGELRDGSQRQFEFGVESGAQRLGHGGHVGRVAEFGVQTLPDLVHAIARLTDQQLVEFGAGGSVAGDHGNSLTDGRTFTASWPTSSTRTCGRATRRGWRSRSRCS